MTVQSFANKWQKKFNSTSSNQLRFQHITE